jgi:hypothetical protein
MQDPWSLVIMLLLAVLVGACLPVLFMTFSTLASLRRLTQRIAPKLDAVLGEVRETTRRLNAATVGMDDSAQRAKKLLDATGDLGESIHRLNQSLKPAVALGSVVGPAVAVAVKSFLDRQAQPDDPDTEGEPVPAARSVEDNEPQLARGGER